MSHRLHANALLLSLLVAALPLFVACSSTGPDKAAATVTSMSKLETELQNAGNQIAATLDTLRELVAEPQGDLRPRFDAYSKSLSKLESAAKSVNQEGARVRGRADVYYADWEASQATISNSKIKKSSEERRAAMLKQQNEINAWIQAFGQRFDGLATDLRDIRTFLVNDLNAGGVKAISGPAKKADKDGKDLREDLDKLVVRMAEVRKATSARGPAAEPEK